MTDCIGQYGDCEATKRSPRGGRGDGDGSEKGIGWSPDTAIVCCGCGTGLEGTDYVWKAARVAKVAGVTEEGNGAAIARVAESEARGAELEW